ncbi:F-box/kelch-repeat protein At3g06240-like [Mercurialis annua]|uniref:F-box/kelch-repeat protein At3g06240-like n=1 Tax=Mercurialis annua TaxID=3986 RepID=UPI0024AE4875|nr:F-box/kelch-repeat protein At3g06240-like [Mercurialis annua]
MVNCPNFVEEILVDILLRLPVKSIIRFKAVHSSWLSFLSSKEFTLQHLRRNKANYSTYKCGFIRVEANQTFGHPSLSFRNLVTATEDGNVVIEEIKEAFRETDSGVRVHGSFNGLLLVSINGHLILWNPSTMEYKRIDIRSLCRYIIIEIGLGYDELNDSYKIILIHAHLETITIEVYSMKTNSWKKIYYYYDEFPYILSQSNQFITLANGIPHWIVARRIVRPCGNCTKKVVLRFDMIDEVFKEVVLPEELQCISEGVQSISMLDGDLCVVASKGGWVMKDYGTAKSWYKLDIDYGFHQRHLLHFLPVGFSNDKNQVVVGINRIKWRSYEQAIVIYNKSSNQYTNFVKLKSNVVSYVETLVSPNNYYN